MPNRLAKETSPYLLQHAHNPVDWYPWCAEAFERARREDKPILLSVGYSACHWCHVMERESFEDVETARLMNELFVNVKVDREERPDVDSIYMQAVQAMTGRGGWPMTSFLTPQLEPFWAGTYFPPDDRPGMPSFRRVLVAVSDAYRNRRDDVQRVAASMREMYDTTRARAQSVGRLSEETLARATTGLLAQLDARHGGFGEAPKFPHTMALEFLLQRWARTGAEAALRAVELSLERMSRGGMYDQIGGGFARYSVDARWLVPHFEKMLYDNALLTRLALHVWQATGNTAARRVVEETMEWLSREMTAPSGGFYSALDADSEGEEGKFYVWTETELRTVLGADAVPAMEYWGVTSNGNFEGHNILNVADASIRIEPAVLARARRALHEARAKRVRPGRDDKVLAAWNGLMLRSVAEAARVLDDDRLRELAFANATFLFHELVREDGRVFRTHKDGVSRISGFLEDYGALGLAALAMYELTYDGAWLDRASRLATDVVRWFWDEHASAFFDTPSDHEELLTRPRDFTDNATPSGTSLATELLLRIGDLTGDADMSRRGTYVLETLAEPMARYPLAFGHALTAADFVVHGAVEVALAGRRDADDFMALDRAIASTYVPSLVLAGGDARHIALLRDRPMKEGRATAYVCRGSVCDEPSTDPDHVRTQLRRATAARSG